MNADALREFADFEALPAATLSFLASRARHMRVPAGRWLVRPGRSLVGRLYLAEGRLRVDREGAWTHVAAGEAGARLAVYPGCSAAQTLTGTRLLRFDAATTGWLEAGGALGVPDVTADDGSWQCRFLGSPLMQRLRPSAWQRILRAMTAAAHDAGDVVVRAGAPAECCYVLCKGRATVHDADGRQLAELGPGDLFGEDALITGAVRNASVVMREPGATVRLAADRFERWLLHEVVVPAAPQDLRVRLSLDPSSPASARLAPATLREAARDLPADRAYAVAGGSSGERYLAAFLLIRAGLDARPLPP